MWVHIGFLQGATVRVTTGIVFRLAVAGLEKFLASKHGDMIRSVSKRPYEGPQSISKTVELLERALDAKEPQSKPLLNPNPQSSTRVGQGWFRVLGFGKLFARVFCLREAGRCGS